jgi:hypothetical protein
MSSVIKAFILSVRRPLNLSPTNMPPFTTRARYQDYTPVSGSESPRYSVSDDLPEKFQSPRTPRRWLYWLNLSSHVLAWTLVGTLLYCNIVPRTWGWNRFQQHKLLPAQLTYSPAQTSIEYEVKVFRQGFENDPYDPDGVDPVFAGPPSDELDASWSNLYNCESSIRHR